MTAPIEITVETAPEAPVVAETQSHWEKFTPELREAKLRGEDLEPLEAPPEPPKETPPAEPPETPPAEPPAKVEPPETPPIEEPVTPVVEPPKEEPERLLVGKYKSPSELEIGYMELMEKLNDQARELGDLRPLKAKPEPEPEDPEPVVDPFDPASIKTHTEWVFRQVDRKNEKSEERIAQGLRQYDKAQPVRKMIEQFGADHPDISPEKQLTVGQHADNMARAARKPVSLEEAYADLFGAKTETPPKPGGTPEVKETAAAIQAASNVPKTVSDVPASPPAGVGGTGAEAESQAQWDAKTEAEREKALRDIPPPPKG